MMNPLDLTGKTVLVTGASSGIGQGAAVYLSRLGAKVVVVGRDEDRLHQTVSKMEGSYHTAIPFDLNNVERIPAWMKEVAATTGPLYGLVHSAGIIVSRPLKILRYQNLLDVQRINVDAAIMLIQGLRQNGVCEKTGASVVLVSSVAGLKGEPLLSAYSATKGALIALARTLAVELASQNIRVNCVSPAMVRTPMMESMIAALPDENRAELERKHPLGLGSPEDVAYAAAFLLSPAGRWITGTNLVLDGGYTA
jgi:NAD(P)-dependent dehydrogenase (short-subunit alcohol dehydrogenase family)